MASSKSFDDAERTGRVTTIGEIVTERDAINSLAWVFSKVAAYTDYESEHLRRAEKLVTDKLGISIAEFRDRIKAYL